MKKFHAAYILVPIFLILSLVSYLWANQITSSFYTYRSPLHGNPPAAGSPIGEPATRRVVFVIIDGLRLDTSEMGDIMPFLNQLREHGASSASHSQPPSNSQPGYATLLTGTWPELNDGPAFNVDYEKIPAITQDTIFAAAKRSNLKTAVSGYYWFGRLLRQEDLDASYMDPADDRVADANVMQAAGPWLADPTYQLLLIHLDQVDYAGHHEGGPRDPRWAEAATRVDDYLKQIVLQMDLKQDTIIITSDHGHINAGGHGGHDQAVLVEPLVLAGKAIQPGKYPDTLMVDIAPTIAALLGTNIPASAQGRVLTEMLVLPEKSTAALPGLVDTQQKTLLNAYAAALGKAAPAIVIEPSADARIYQQLLTSLKTTRQTSERLPRFALVVLLFGLIVFLGFKLLKKQVWYFVLAAGIYTAVFYIRDLLIDQRALSFSSIQSSNELIFYILGTSVAAFGFTWLLMFITKRTYQGNLANAFHQSLIIGAAVLLVTLIPAFLFFALNGIQPEWFLPNLGLTYLAVICLIQALFIGPLSILYGLVAMLITRFSPRQV